MKLQGKRALITGATSGIGLATTRLFVEEGARVAVVGRDVARMEALRQSLGERVVPILGDVRRVDDLHRIRDEVVQALGSLDIFFPNAGVAYATPLADTTEAQYDTLMDINVKGVFLSMQAMAPILSDGASVILNTSWLNEVGTPGMSMLSASKAAVRSLARTWSSELLARRIRVNAVSPGAIDTPILDRRGATPEENAHAKQQLASRIPVGRLGTAEDIARAALFLASDDSRYMLGAEIVVDGGFSAL
ncbi:MULTISPECIES: SDR family oxidoreductase [Pandoraea]|uniref:SDR family oxidoreductase n=1 Tax=Pandoraea TaxID=93217 RepID=UPI001F5D89B1|nr:MULTISPECIES: SDR family oxidoreductase [Pandoraea]MCI3207458.1 short-chain dehydrogenase [Pandoraea sp. LA3]MDN4585487.1 short-chain dehydrogenase [Pandoraea capi]